MRVYGVATQMLVLVAEDVTDEWLPSASRTLTGVPFVQVFGAAWKALPQGLDATKEGSLGSIVDQTECHVCAGVRRPGRCCPWWQGGAIDE